MKFQYSPGLIGYGAKGVDGSTGLQALGIYFTDRNPFTDFITLSTSIKNSEVLWSSAAPGTKLPGGRKYINGDLFIDPRGFIYEIIDAAIGDYENTGMTLNKSTFFTDAPWFNETDLPSEFFRFFNKYIDPSSSRYLIDNVFTDISGINYSKSPSKIYGISSKNFTRIEYSNINDVSYNAFTLYSSGENVITDDHKSLGIVRHVSSNNFRIGNLDDNNLIRDVDLVFDDVSLMYKRETSNMLNKNTAPGTVLTNFEKNTDVLFGDINSVIGGSFNPLPLSFSCSSHPSHLIFSWILPDFVAGDTEVSGTFHFTDKKDVSVGSFHIDASMMRPLMFHNVGNAGSLTISALTLGKTYEYYMSICKNGWERNSALKQITTTTSTAFMTIVNPNTAILSASAAGIFSPTGGGPDPKRYPVQIITDSFTGWDMIGVPPPNWIKTFVTGTSTPFTGAPVAGTYNFDVSLSVWTGYSPRTGIITLSSEAPTKIITVNQARRLPINHTMSWSGGGIQFNPPLDPGQTVSVSVKLMAYAYAHGSATHPRTCNTQVNVFKNGSEMEQCFATAYDKGGGDGQQKTYVNYTFTGVVNGTTLTAVQDSTYFDCGCWSYSLSNPYITSRSYVEIVSATDGYDTFTPGPLPYYTITKLKCGCSIATSTVSSDPWP